MDSWGELANPRDLTKIFQTPEYAAWKSLRESEDSRYIGLAMPRFLARLPYGAKTEPVDEFAFEEDTAGAESSSFTWCNSAYAMATNITRAFKLYGWTTRIRGIESGGAVEGLPAYTFPTDDGGVQMKCPTEIAISDRREAELAKNGFMPLIHKKNSDFAAFIGAQSLQKPQEYDDPDATANANLSARLPYIFATCRFAHYLKCMVRDKVGSTKTQDQLQRWLQSWLNSYVDGSPNDSDEAYKATHPLAEGRVELAPNEENPGYYSARFYLKPHYQLEGVNVSLRLVSRMPK
jgi:type VI secretion system protein ImpC